MHVKSVIGILMWLWNTTTIILYIASLLVTETACLFSRFKDPVGRSDGWKWLPHKCGSLQMSATNWVGHLKCLARPTFARTYLEIFIHHIYFWQPTLITIVTFKGEWKLKNNNCHTMWRDVFINGPFHEYFLWWLLIKPILSRFRSGTIDRNQLIVVWNLKPEMKHSVRMINVLSWVASNDPSRSHWAVLIASPG